MAEPRGAYRPRRWEIVFDLAGRDEDDLVEQVERVLCGPDHPDGPGDCAVQWFSCEPGPAEGPETEARGG